MKTAQTILDVRFPRCMQEAADANLLDTCVQAGRGTSAYNDVQDTVVRQFANVHVDKFAEMANADALIQHLTTLPQDAPSLTEEAQLAVLGTVDEEDVISWISRHAMPRYLDQFDAFIQHAAAQMDDATALAAEIGAAVDEKEQATTATDSHAAKPTCNAAGAGPSRCPGCTVCDPDDHDMQQDTEEDPVAVKVTAFEQHDDGPRYMIQWSDNTAEWMRYCATAPPEWMYDLVVAYWLDQKSMPPHCLDNDPEDDGMGPFADLV